MKHRRPCNRRARTLAASAVAAVAAVAVAVPLLLASSAQAGAAGHKPRKSNPIQLDPAYKTRELCKPDEHKKVAGGRYEIRNDVWLIGDETVPPEQCMRTTYIRPHFTVSKSGAATGGPGVQGFPYVFAGCSYGICGTQGSLPARWTSRALTVRMKARLGQTGSWDYALDMWFDRAPITDGQATGAEVMVWVAAHHRAWPGSPVVTVRGVRYYLRAWTTGTRKHWPLIVFRRVHSRRSVRHLHVAPFLRDAARLHLLSRRDYLLNVEAGFELWRGGTGLAITRFSVRR